MIFVSNYGPDNHHILIRHVSLAFIMCWFIFVLNKTVNVYGKQIQDIIGY